MEMIAQFDEKIPIENNVHQIMILHKQMQIIHLENYL
jgi:hypothetical protein